MRKDEVNRDSLICPNPLRSKAGFKCRFCSLKHHINSSLSQDTDHHGAIQTMENSLNHSGEVREGRE